MSTSTFYRFGPLLPLVTLSAGMYLSFNSSVVAQSPTAAQAAAETPVPGSDKSASAEVTAAVSNENAAVNDAAAAVADPSASGTELGVAAVTPDSADALGATEVVPAARVPVTSLNFSFERTPWREVIRWLADQCDLALQYEELPAGSFTYSDAKTFSLPEAIDRVNLFLLPQGYTLVRSGRLLSVINLGDPRSLQQLDALAELITPLELDTRNQHDVVKCVFPLQELDAQDAVEELSTIKLMTKPAVFSKTNQLMITDTVAKLKNVKTILDAFGPKGLDNGTVMKTFSLKHITAEDVLVVARPHLGLATDEMIGIDVSLSTDVQGEHLFVTGVEDRVKLVENLVTALDQPPLSLTPTEGQTELRSHLVQGGNAQTVYNVLQTLLAGKSLRLTVDAKANSIVALATPAVQEEIAQTVQQLQAAEADFEVIPLKSVDPYYVISLLEQMLDLPSTSASAKDSPTGLPKIDADPGNKRLFVRATRFQIDQIKKIVEALETSDTASGGTDSPSDSVRVLPFRRSEADALVETAAKFWRKPNPIILLPADKSVGAKVIERVVGTQPEDSRFIAKRALDRDGSSSRYLTDNVTSQAAMIRCQWTARGLIIQSEDREALDDFEAHLRALNAPTDSIVSPPIVYYLQYVQPEDSLRMLAELLDGGESAKEGQAGTLVNGYISSPGSFLSSIVTSRDGTATMISGTTTVVADTRLNRLIVQGATAEIQRIQDYLEIIDKDKSIAENKTNGTSRVIELFNARANDVATVIRDTYGSRVSSSSKSTGPTPSGAPQQAREVAGKAGDEAKVDDKKGPSKAVSNQPIQDLKPVMSLAVHEPSNSLIVTAPEQLFDEVERLAQLIDTRSEQQVEIVTTSNAAMLKAFLQPSATGNVPRSNSSERGNSASSQSAARSRLFEMLKSGGGQ